MTALPRRQEVPVEETWSLAHLFPSVDAYHEALEAFVTVVDDLVRDFQGKVKGSKDVALLLDLAERQVSEDRGGQDNCPVLRK